ncbi:MAG: NADH-quinone oxidoreductase subunit K [Candidatus Micrarchaeia archaeon]
MTSLLMPFVLLSFAMFSIGLAGIISSKHAVIIVLSSEVGLVASMLFLLSFFAYYSQGNALGLLFSIWSIMSAEAIMLIVFYRYLAKAEMSLDISKLSKYRD